MTQSPLTDEELQMLREVLESQRRYKWLAVIIRNSMAWIAVVVGGGILIWGAFKGAVKGALGN